MKRSHLIGLLVVLHVALLAGVFHLLRVTEEAKPPLTVPKLVFKKVPVVERHTNVVTVTQAIPFEWAQLESEDYRTYINRLRAIGCPEETIRDIIIADVEKLMAPRLQQLNPRPGPLEYWKAEERELEDPLQYLETAGQRLDIDFEKRDVILELLGVDLVAERAKLQGEEDRYGQRLGFLSNEKRLRVREILERYNRAEMLLRERAWRDGGSLGAEDQAALRQLEQRRDAEVAAQLTPVEWRQYELQLSPTAYQVRDALFGMNATEQEFLAVFDAQKAFNQRFPDPAAASDAAKAEFQANLRRALGPARYADYERAQDPEFRAMTVAVVRQGLSRAKAEQAYEIKRATLSTVRQVLNRQDLTDEQKELALHAITEEARNTVSTLLGEQAFSQFLRSSGAEWLGE